MVDCKRRGEVYSLPQPGIFEPRLALYSRSHLTFTDRGESRAFYPLPTLASACPPSMQTFFLILSFAISSSISHWCNFPVEDLYDVKICVVYVATLRRAAFRHGRADLSKYLLNDMLRSIIVDQIILNEDICFNILQPYVIFYILNKHICYYKLSIFISKKIGKTL